MITLSCQKLRNVKYRFWLQQEVKISSNKIFWFTTSNCMVFHATFVLKFFGKSMNHMHRMFSLIPFWRISWNVKSCSSTCNTQKLSKPKITVFGNKKGSKIGLSNFSERRMKSQWHFDLQFYLKDQSHVSIRCKSFDAVFKWNRLVR